MDSSFSDDAELTDLATSSSRSTRNSPNKKRLRYQERKTAEPVKSEEQYSKHDGGKSKRMKGRKPAAGKKRGGKSIPSECWDGFTYSASYYEDHQKPLYGVSFSPYVGFGKEDFYLFATVGSNRVTIYKCPKGENDLHLAQCYQDDDNEEYFCVTWLYDPAEEQHMFAVGGERGIIRIIAPEIGENIAVFKGHGKAINELRTHPIHSDVFLSAGRDRSVKIWYAPSGCCLLMVGGASTHNDEVLTADFDVCGSRVVTGSMDHYVKVWDIETKLEMKLKQAKDLTLKTKVKPSDYCPGEVHFPQVVTNEIHTNYIDCARFFVKDFIITKSCQDEICVWKIGDESTLDVAYHSTRAETNVSIYRTLPLPNSDVWFMKLVVDPTYELLAAGDTTGKIKIWPVGKDFMTCDEEHPHVLSHRLMRRCVRQIDFSPTGDTLVAVCDDASVWRWNRRET